MKTYFRQLRIFQVIVSLVLVLVVSILALALFASLIWYKNLPEKSEIRARFKLGKFLTRFEIAHLFCDWRNLGIPIYDLTINDKNLNKILKNLPPEGSLMTDEYKEYAKAKFSYKDKSYDVKVRMHGLCPNHWEDEKKSWRIKFNSQDLLERKQSINLIIPQDRAFIMEYLSNHIARKFNLLVPEDKFVFLRINGILQGIYYEIEQPTAKFLELHSKVDTANFYREDNWDWLKYGLDPIFSDIGHWKKNSSEPLSQFDNYAELNYLLSLLNNADDKRFYREITALVNMDNFLTWQAHSMIMGSYHQSEHGNMNLYFNIIDGKFEFMPIDVHIYPLTEQFFDSTYNPLVTRLLKNPEYLHSRNLILWRYLSNLDNLKDDLGLYDNTYRHIRKAFYADRKKGFTNYFFDSEIRRMKEIFVKNREKIIANLSFANIFIDAHLFPNSANILADIDMISQGFSAVELSGIKVSFDKDVNPSEYSGLELFYDSNNSGSFESDDMFISKLTPDASGKFLLTAPFSFLLYPDRDEKLQPAKKYYKFFIVSSGAKISKQYPISLEVSAINAVTRQAAQLRYHYVDDRELNRFSEITDSADNFVSRYPIFKKDASNPNTFVIPAGEYNINANIIVPIGLNIIIEPGVVLKFGKGVSFISYSKLTAKGGKGNPIVFTAQDGKEPWGNLAVVGHAADNTEFEYVIVEYGGESFINGIYFTGAIAIHSASAKVNKCILRYNTGDDTINVKAGESDIEETVFYKNHSDGADYDFSKGAVKNNYIKDNGGDGVDLCRSDVYIEGNLIEGSGDKGISVGEASRPIILNNLIRLCNIGVASKDMSYPSIINNTIIENNNGIEAYMKKQVFGPSGGVVRNTIICANKTSFKIEDVSSLDISDSIVEGWYKGKNILNLTPIFINAKDGDYRVTFDKDSVKGNLEALKEIPGYGELKEVAIGILSAPKALSVSDFSDR